MGLLQRLNPFAGNTKSGQPMTSADLADVLLAADTSSDTGVTVTPANAMYVGPVFACVRVLSESVGVLPIKVYEQQGESQVAKPGSQLAKVLAKPNDFQTCQEFLEMAVAHLALRGNFYAYKNTFNGKLLELIPFAAGSVTPRITEKHEVVYDVSFANGTRDIMTGDQIFHVKGFSTDGIVGLGPIAHARQSIGLARATEKHGGRLFKNGAQPGGVLSTNEQLKPETFERVKQSWNEKHQGVDNAHKVAILEAGLSYQSIGMTSGDAQFLETRKYQRSEIAGIFRVPLHKIGDLDKATFSNIESQGQEFVTDSLLPYLTRIEQRINTTLVAESQRGKVFVKFTVNALMRGDMKARAEYYTKQMQNGVLSPNEIRALEDMNPREGGDIYLTPMNMLINGKPAVDEPAPEPETDSEATPDAD